MGALLRSAAVDQCGGAAAEPVVNSSHLLEIQERILWVAARLEAHHKRFLANEPVALLDALEICATMQVPMPQWAADGYVRRFLRWTEFDAATLDEAFGVTRKGVHLAASRRRQAQSYGILREIARLQHEGVPTGDRLFERAAKSVGVNAKMVRKIYYDTPPHWRKLTQKVPVPQALPRIPQNSGKYKRKKV
jgi:hypothetical protein